MVSTSLKKYVVLGFAFLFLTSTAFAVENFRVPVPHLRVYSQPSTLSAVITMLNGGQVVQAGSNPAGGFKKVLILDKMGKKKIGYVALSDLPVGPRVATSKSKSRSSRSTGGGLRGHWAFGLVGGVAYDMESGRTITSASNQSLTSSALTGTAPQFGAFLYVPWGNNMALNFYGYYKSSTLSGTYPDLIVPSISDAISITQSYLSVGGIWEIYMGRSNWWIGPALQLDYGLSASVVLNGGNTISLSTNQFIGLFAATGYDFGLSDSFYLTPQIQLGADVNASPMIIEGNFLLNFAYKY